MSNDRGMHIASNIGTKYKCCKFVRSPQTVGMPVFQDPDQGVSACAAVDITGCVWYWTKFPFSKPGTSTKSQK